MRKSKTYNKKRNKHSKKKVKNNTRKNNPKCITDESIRIRKLTQFVELNNKKVVSIKEKPKKTKSRLAITGLYFFDKNASKLAKKLEPSRRNELEIVDLIKAYLRKKKLKVELMGRGSAWLDTGNPESLFDTSQFIQSIEKRQGLKIACLEEIALSNKWVTKKEIHKRIKFYGRCSYSEYLKKLI